MGVLVVHIHVYCVHTAGQKRARDPRNWNYTCLSAAMFVLGIAARSSARADSAPTTEHLPRPRNKN